MSTKKKPKIRWSNVDADTKALAAHVAKLNPPERPRARRPRPIYKVWIEIEAYDTQSENGRTLEGALGFAATAEYKTLDEAIRFADRLNATGQQLAHDDYK